MGPKEVSDEQVRKALLEAKGNKTTAARALGVPRSTLRDRAERMEQPRETTKQTFKSEQARDSWYIESSRLETADDCLRRAGVDLDIWEIDRVVSGGWDVTLKIKEGGGDKVVTKQNQQIKVWLRRKVPKSIEDATGALLKRFSKYRPKYPKLSRTRPKDPHLLEISVFDHHFGKLAWAKETGTDWDLPIAERVYLEAVEDLVARSMGFEIEQIIFPLGQDFFHIDSASRETIHGTSMEDVDGRYAKIFEAGVMACVQAIEGMIPIAPVKVLWVPGNHDRTSSWHLVSQLRAWFRDCRDVVVDPSPKARKYHRYGINLIGFAHGDEEKHHDLPLIMAGEVPEDWAQTVHREIHVGHWHKRKETRFNAGDSHVGVTVRVIPSLTGTDYWHYIKGYVGGQRTAEAYVWSKDRGLTATLYTHAGLR